MHFYMDAALVTAPALPLGGGSGVGVCLGSVDKADDRAEATHGGGWACYPSVGTALGRGTLVNPIGKRRIF